MAFPLAHPAAVLPLFLLPRRYASVTGLIIGSLAPDFRYLVTLRADGADPLPLPSMVLLELLAGLASCLLFHALMRDALILNLPNVLRRRFQRFMYTPWAAWFRSNWITIIISVLAGIATHRLWDSLDLTHASGHVYRALLAWTSSLEVGSAQILLIRFLQHLPSLAGIMAIAIFILSLPREETRGKGKPLMYWGFTSATALAYTALRVVFADAGQLQVTSLLLALGGGGLLGVALFPFLHRMNAGRQ